MKIKNDLNLSFCIWDFEDITDKEISKELDLIPHKTYKKGERTNPKFSRVSKQNGWIYGTPYNNSDNFSEQMDKILDVLELKIEILKKYSQKYYLEFSCAIFLNNREESTPWIHLGARYNSFISKINTEFDIEIYYPPLDENL